ncbi:MAG: aminotransferase class I/II-fold pyridoxal phosphate-dependent enzyme, partial [Candidatus Rokuibacteriota bacterium]
MTTAPESFVELLSTRARIGWGGPPAARPVANALYEFGGGYPDPASFPYDGLIDATARMIRAEGAEALTYGEPQGYRGLRELVCHKYGLFEGLKVGPDNLIISNGSGHALSLAFSAFVDPGDVILSEAPTFSGTLQTIRRHGPQVLDVPVDGDGLVVEVAREHLANLRRQGRRCKLIYTIVNFQNPSGPTLTLRRRRELIDLAHE